MLHRNSENCNAKNRKEFTRPARADGELSGDRRADARVNGRQRPSTPTEKAFRRVAQLRHCIPVTSPAAAEGYAPVLCAEKTELGG
jgi:hypothetical protein